MVDFSDNATGFNKCTCQACGIEIVNRPHGRKRLYCSKKCQSGKYRNANEPCANCGGPIIGHKRKFCSDLCRMRSRNKNPRGPRQLKCAHCGSSFESWLSKSKFCSKDCGSQYRQENPSFGECQCKQCGKTYRPKARDRTTYCSRKCAFEHKQEHGHFGTPGKQSSNAELREAYAIADGCLAWLSRSRKCVKCGCNRTLRRPNRKWTCETCSAPPECVQCQRCGIEIVRKINGRFVVKAVKYCTECAYLRSLASVKRYKAMRDGWKRARPRDRAIEIIIDQDVFCSDLWKCGICGEAVDHALTNHHPRSAEMDHIVPLSKGGEHARSNVQCTHRMCNEIKSNLSQSEAIAIVVGRRRSGQWEKLKVNWIKRWEIKQAERAAAPYVDGSISPLGYGGAVYSPRSRGNRNRSHASTISQGFSDG